MIKTETLLKIETASSSRKTVNRTYKTKKGIKTKTYTYTKSPLLFRKTAKGYKLIDSAWKEFEKNIRKNTSPTEANSIINEARRIKQDIMNGQEVASYGGDRQYNSSKGMDWNRIDVHSMVSRISTGRVNKYLINMGLDPAEVVKYVNAELAKLGAGSISQADLLNEAYWQNDTAEVPTNKGKIAVIRIEFNYDGYSGIDVTAR